MLIRRRMKSIPKDTIQAFAQSKGYVLTSKIKSQLIDEVLEILRSEEIDELLAEYEHGGKGSIYLYLLNENDVAELRNRDSIIRRLEDLGIGNPFGEMLRPELDRTPRLVYAEYIQGEKLHVLTAHQGTMQERLIGWEIEEYRPTVLSKTFIHLNDGLIEVRASGHSATAIVRQITHYLGVTMPNPVEFSEEEIAEITARLAARTRIARHRAEIGGLEYIEYGAAEDVEDLNEIPEYQDEVGERPLRRKAFKMIHRQFDQNITISFEMAVDQCYILFRTPVGEGAINRVLSEVRAIKNIPRN